MKTRAMSWDEWAAHDGVALADRVRAGEITPAELAHQAAAGICPGPMLRSAASWRFSMTSSSIRPETAQTCPVPSPACRS